MNANYAKALYELAEEENICDLITNEIDEIRDILEETPDLIRILDCPGIDLKERQNTGVSLFLQRSKAVFPTKPRCLL